VAEASTTAPKGWLAGVHQFLWRGDRSLLDRIDESKVFELGVTDVGGMVIPRSIVEWTQRNFDMARETFLREIDGTFNLLILPGLLNRAMVSALNHVPALNPKRLFHGAWVDGPTLQQLGRHAEALLTDPIPTTAQQLRQQFIHRVIDHFRLNDQAFLESLAHTGDVAGQPMGRVLTDRAVGFDAAKTLGLAHPLPTAQRARLDGFAQLFDLHPNPYMGMHPLDESVAQLALQTPDLRPELRLRLSQQQQRSKATLNQKRMEQLTTHGFSNGVTLLGPQPTQHVPVRLSLPQVVNALDSFLQQYLDPLLAHPVTGRIDETPLGAEAKQRILNQLVGQHPDGKVRGWWPQKDDALIPYSHKSQMLTSVVPVVATLGAAFTFPMFNNFITWLKYGHSFFPGAGVPPQAKSTPPAGAASATAAASPSPTATPSQARITASGASRLVASAASTGGSGTVAMALLPSTPPGRLDTAAASPFGAFLSDIAFRNNTSL
jgi:hypothetical protein